MNEEKVIYEFRKNVGEKVLISFTVYKGTRLVNVRIYYNAGPDQDNWKPTPKGLTLKREQVMNLKEGIDKAVEEFEKELPGLREQKEIEETG
jgi:hypothetical protein